MSKKSTSQKHAELKALGSDSRDKLWKRLSLTDEILRDREYVDSTFGSESRLIEVMEADEWAEFASRPGLPMLLRLYRAYPDRKTWELYKFDWCAISELQKSESNDGEKKQRVDWKAKCAELELLVREQAAEIREQAAEIRILREMLERLERREVA